MNISITKLSCHYKGKSASLESIVKYNPDTVKNAPFDEVATIVYVHQKLKEVDLEYYSVECVMEFAAGFLDLIDFIAIQLIIHYQLDEVPIEFVSLMECVTIDEKYELLLEFAKKVCDG